MKMGFYTTLQKLCIDVIAKDIHRYISALSNTEDSSFKRDFEFLKRIYSYEIVSKLELLEDLQSNYIEVLVNKYTKIIQTDWFQHVEWKNVVAKFVEIGSNIQQMFFYEFEDEKPWINIIPYLINVEEMIFRYPCNDEIMKYIAQFCPNIREIFLATSCVTNDGIKYLCMKENGIPSCPKLKKLYIADSDVDVEGFTYVLENLHSLEETDYRDLPNAILYSQSENYGKIKSYNLTRLNLLPFEHNETNFRICLTLCPRLKSLSCKLRKEEELNFFPNHLESLELRCFLGSKINIYTFLIKKGRMLTFVSLSKCILSVCTLAESCPCLQTLTLKTVSFKNDDFTSVFHQLKTCIFVDTTTEPTTTKSVSLLLTSSPKLECITFHRCDLSSSDLKSEILRSCKSFLIANVVFRTCKVGMDFAKEFLKHCRLHYFTLYDCDISKIDVVDFISFAQTLPYNHRVLTAIDEEDKVDFVAFLCYDFLKFLFTKHIEYP